MKAIALALLAAWAAYAGELAVLASGMSLRVDGHEQAGGKIVLLVAGGRVEVPASQVVRFDQEEPAQPPAAASVPEEPPPPAPQPPQPTLRQLVDQAAARYGLPPALLHSVVRAESAYNPNAVSPKGAIGLMQLMPGTAAELEADPRDPTQNVEAGARYLRDLLIKYDYSSHRALAAYNAGPGAVDKYRGVPPYAETRQYVDRVVGAYLKSLLR